VCTKECRWSIRLEQSLTGMMAYSAYKSRCPHSDHRDQKSVGAPKYLVEAVAKDVLARPPRHFAAHLSREVQLDQDQLKQCVRWRSLTLKKENLSVGALTGLMGELRTKISALERPSKVEKEGFTAASAWAWPGWTAVPPIHEDGKEVSGTARLVVLMSADRFILNYVRRALWRLRIQLTLDETWSISTAGNMLVPIITSAPNRSHRVIAYALISHRDEATYRMIWKMLRKAVKGVSAEYAAKGGLY